MRNVNLDQLQTLIAIADLGTFAAAAQALHLAPPTISLHVKELESWLATPLVIRGRRLAELTPAGATLVEGGRKLLAASDDLFEQVRRRAQGRMGLVRVAVSAGVSTRLLPLMLERLQARNPDIELRLEAIGSADAMRRLKAGTLDLALVASPQPPMPEVQLQAWRVDEMAVLVPAAWNPPEAITPQWLAERRWASFTPATQMHGLIAAWFGQAGLNPRPYLSLSYPGALRSLAAASQAAAILPHEELADLAEAPELCIRPMSPVLRRSMALAIRQSGLSDPALQAVQAVIESFAR